MGVGAVADDEPALEGGAPDRTEGVTRRAIDVEAFVHGAERGRPPEGEDIGIDNERKDGDAAVVEERAQRKAQTAMPRV